MKFAMPAVKFWALVGFFLVWLSINQMISKPGPRDQFFYSMKQQPLFMVSSPMHWNPSLDEYIDAPIITFHMLVMY